MKNSANNSIWDIRLFSIYKTVSVENLTSQHSHNISATAAAEDEHHRRHHNESIPTYIHKSQTYIININHIDIVIFFSVVHTWTVSSLLLRFRREKKQTLFYFLLYTLLSDSNSECLQRVNVLFWFYINWLSTHKNPFYCDLFCNVVKRCGHHEDDWLQSDS